jgi:hypothetical protein
MALVEWIIVGFLVIHFLVLVGAFAAFVNTLIARGSRIRSGSEREHSHP